MLLDAALDADDIVFLQRFAHHRLEHEGYVALDGQLHLARRVGRGQELNPHVQCDGAVLCLELDGLQRLSLDDAELYLAHHRGLY